MEDIVGHHCGLFGAYNVPNAAARAYMGLFALQHRGQESAGIVSSDGKLLRARKGMGLVSDVFEGQNWNDLPGHMAMGHVRYSTTGSSRVNNIQPLVMDYSRGQMAVGHNGNLVNAKTLRDEYEAYGAIFQTTTDTEVVLHLLAHPEWAGREDALNHCLNQIKGAYCLLFMTHDRLIAARDPQGFRPLVIGRLHLPGQIASIGDGYIVASETCALDQVGAKFEREIEPGEIVEFGPHGPKSTFFAKKEECKPAHCAFEHVYFARPDSMIFGDSVHDVRIRLGERLAIEHPVDADVVFAVPDSGLCAAIGYSRKSGIPLDMGFIRSHYVGRSFIKPQQIERETVVDMKFNVVRSVVEGKRVIVVEDSLIRGTTFRKQAKILKAAGAKEVHLRISCPPTKNACYYGIDFPDKDELIAARLPSVQAVAEYLGINSLGYISVEGLLESVSKPKSSYCTACWTGKYPVKPVDAADKYGMEAKC